MQHSHPEAPGRILIRETTDSVWHEVHFLKQVGATTHSLEGM